MSVYPEYSLGYLYRVHLILISHKDSSMDPEVLFEVVQKRHHISSSLLFSLSAHLLEGF